MAHERAQYLNPDNRSVLSHETFFNFIKRNLTCHELTMQFDLARIIFFVCYIFDAALHQLLFSVSQNAAELFVRANVFPLRRTFGDANRRAFISCLQSLATLLQRLLGAFTLAQIHDGGLIEQGSISRRRSDWPAAKECRNPFAFSRLQF